MPKCILVLCSFMMGPKPESAESVKQRILHKYHDKFVIDDEFVYVNALTPVKLLCKTNHNHGYYQVKPYILFRKVGSPMGCPTCVKLASVELYRQRFLNACKNLYGDRYDYSNVDYIDNRKKVEIKCNKGHTFWMAPDNHQQGHECPFCSPHRHSKTQLFWLKHIMETEDVQIQHYENQGEFTIDTVGKVDGYCESTNTVYEFHGCWWHGCPECFPDRTEEHHWTKKTYEQLYQETLERCERIRTRGFTLVMIWEHQWKAIERRKNKDLHDAREAAKRAKS